MGFDYSKSIKHPKPQRDKQTPSPNPRIPTKTLDTPTHLTSYGKITLRYNSQLYSIGIGRAHNGTKTTALTQKLNITISNTHTGEILRQLTLDPTRKYQPQNTKQAEPSGFGLSPMS